LKYAPIASYSLASAQLIDVLTDLFGIRGVLRFIRRQNGPDFVSVGLRSFLESLEIGTSNIGPGNPWQNGDVERIHSRFRNEGSAGSSQNF